MLWLEDKQQLITCAKDKKIKIWSLPKVWYDEEEVKAKVAPEEVKAPQSEKVIQKQAATAVIEQVIVVDPNNPLGGGAKADHEEVMQPMYEEGFEQVDSYQQQYYQDNQYEGY